MVYGELNRKPISIHVKSRILNYWCKILNGKQSKLSCIMYKLMYSMSQKGFLFKWINYVKSLLENCGLNNIWLEQNAHNNVWLINKVKQVLNDQFQQDWVSDCCNSSKGTSYNLFTNYNFCTPFYISSNLSKKNISTLVRFRTSNHKLPIEYGRWLNIERSNRLCTICNSDIGDEYHYIMTCKHLDSLRKQYIPEKFIIRPNTLKFFNLFSTTKLSTLNKLCIFIRHINSIVCPPG